MGPPARVGMYNNYQVGPIGSVGAVQTGGSQVYSGNQGGHQGDHVHLGQGRPPATARAPPPQQHQQSAPLNSQQGIPPQARPPAKVLPMTNFESRGSQNNNNGNNYGNEGSHRGNYGNGGSVNQGCGSLLSQPFQGPNAGNAGNNGGYWSVNAVTEGNGNGAGPHENNQGKSTNGWGNQGQRSSKVTGTKRAT
jgi:hypothetical protein